MQVMYDESNLSMEQIQELFLATQGIKNAAQKMKRPKFVMKKQKFFWTQKRVDDLKIAARIGLEKFKCRKKCGIGHYMYNSWLKLNPGAEISKSRVLARHNFQIRYERRLLNNKLEKIMIRWDEMCANYRVNEENIEVVDETQVKKETEPALLQVKEVNS